MANSYLNRTTGGSATGATTWTYSVWLKRSKLGGGSAQKILAAGSSSSDRTEINLGGSDTLDNVCDRGATTNQAITATGGVSDGSGSLRVEEPIGTFDFDGTNSQSFFQEIYLNFQVQP